MINYRDYMAQVSENIKSYCAELSNVDKKVRPVAFKLKSLHPEDMFLFSVIGYEVIDGEEKWCVWETWNESTKSMGNGSYWLTHDEAWEMYEGLSEYINTSYKAII